MTESAVTMPEAVEAPSVEEQPSEVVEQAGDQSAPINWRQQYETDAALAKFVQEEANRLYQKSRDRERRAQARRLAAEVDSAPDESTKIARASELAKLVATEEHPDDKEMATFVAEARTAEPALAQLRNTDEYKELWETHGKADMDRRWHAGPEAFATWVWEQVTEMRVEKRAREKSKPLAEATAADIANQRLRNLPTPMTGAGGPSVGGMTLDRLLGLDHAERVAWKAGHKSEYDQLVALAAAG